MHRTGPRGLGRSYVDGLRHALATTDADLICQMDADLSHNPDYLPELVNADRAVRRRHRLPLLARRQRGQLAAPSDFPERVRQQVHPGRHRGSRHATAPAASAAGAATALAKLPLERMVSDGYAFLVEMLYEASRRGCRIGETPIIFVERRQGQSKVSSAVLAESLIVPVAARLQPIVLTWAKSSSW